MSHLKNSNTILKQGATLTSGPFKELSEKNNLRVDVPAGYEAGGGEARCLVVGAQKPEASMFVQTRPTSTRSIGFCDISACISTSLSSDGRA